MDKLRRDILELMAAIETKDPRLDEVAEIVKAGFNGSMVFQYGEVLRRAQAAKLRREAEIQMEADE